MMLFSMFLVKGSKRVSVVGWICAAINLAVFAAPLSIMRQVIRTKRVEFMPFSLSFFLTLCAIMWFFYGFFGKDFYIALPNVIGFLLGITQMILYLLYKKANKYGEMKLKQHQGAHEDMKSSSAEVPKSAANKNEDLVMNVIMAQN
ncbi:hypothetical protein F0562_027224 [Nyssa sinensis]|uniref:Bidirectional sugar transporter SWEET n=1 Tax=Nyssa sinensis TaxID=561372 RepID=A0A5J5B5R9_9ASTE|nr:hypothetical protein F0562_027224 [Nyssa sinensis]